MLNRKFGVEMEIVGITREQALRALTAIGVEVRDEGYNHTTRGYWKLVPDGSVHNGFEVVSPVLEGEAGLETLRAVATALDDMGATADRRCGLHVHIDAAGLTTEQIRTIVTRYAAFEDEIDAFMPASRRGNANSYCGSVKEVAMRERFLAARSITELANAQPSRYFKVNLKSHQPHGTVEFRQHSGTVNAAKVCNWVRFLQNFVELAVNPAPVVSGLAMPAPATVATTVLAGRQAELADMLRAGEVTLEAMQARFGWLPHTARAAVTRLRQAGLEVASVRIFDSNGNGKPGYRLAGQVAPSTETRTVFTGIEPAVATFYRQRAAVLAARG